MRKWERILHSHNLGMERGLGGHWLIYGIQYEYKNVTRNAAFYYSLWDKTVIPTDPGERSRLAKVAREYRRCHPENTRSAQRRYRERLKNACES